jgi:hypothetical protein
MDRTLSRLLILRLATPIPKRNTAKHYKGITGQATRIISTATLQRPHYAAHLHIHARRI